MASKRLSTWWIIIFGLFGVAGAWMVNYAMVWGPWVYSDSVAYIEVARNLLLGRGPVQIKGSGHVMLLTDRPPFYSMVLALVSHNGERIIQTAQILNVFLFFVFIFSIAVWLYALSRQPWLSLGVCLILGSSLIMIQNFTGVMSEPFFCVLGAVSLFMLLTFLRKQAHFYLWLSALCAGLAFLSRFTGITFLGAGGLALLLFQYTLPRKKWTEIILYVAIGLSPFMLWTIYLKFTGGYPGNYAIPSVQDLLKLLQTVLTALLKIPLTWIPWAGGAIGALHTRYQVMISGSLFLVVVGLIVALVMMISKKEGMRSLLDDANFQLGAVFTGFCMVYAAFIILTYLFVKDYKPSLDERMFSPLLFGGTIGLLALLNFAVQPRHPAMLWRTLPFIIGLIFLTSYAGPAYHFIRDMHDKGLGYTSKDWQKSEVINAVNHLPANTHIISDNIDVLMLYTQRSASRIPELERRTKEPLDQVFGNDRTDPVEALFHANQAVLVLFNQGYWQFYELYGENGTEARFQGLTRGLYPYYRGTDGVIYYYSRPK